jgi:phospholipase C
MNGSSDTSQDTPLCTSKHAAGGYQDRCGPSQRLPLLVVSPYSKVNHVDHHYTEQASITKFIEENWGVGQIGDASFDSRAGDLDGLFDFRRPRAGNLFLDPKTGARQYG